MENRVYLNDDWKFSEQFTEEMLGDGFDVGNMTPVRLPHTVKETPLHYFDESVYQMVSGYRRDVFIPEKWRGKRLLLTIDGAAHESEVYWNGKKIGEHHCGYTAFTMDVSDDAIYGIRNTLVVKVDSRESVNIPPFGFVIDYMTYGGLYREVWLDIKEKTYLKDVFVREIFPVTPADSSPRLRRTAAVRILASGRRSEDAVRADIVFWANVN